MYEKTVNTMLLVSNPLKTIRVVDQLWSVAWETTLCEHVTRDLPDFHISMYDTVQTFPLLFNRRLVRDTWSNDRILQKSQ